VAFDDWSRFAAPGVLEGRRKRRDTFVIESWFGPINSGILAIRTLQIARAGRTRTHAAGLSILIYRGFNPDGTAVQNVSDALRALQNDADTLRAARDSERAAKISFDLARQQMQSGNANVLLLLTGQTTYLQAVTQVVQARSARLADTAALFAAVPSLRVFSGSGAVRFHQPPPSGRAQRADDRAAIAPSGCVVEILGFLHLMEEAAPEGAAGARLPRCPSSRPSTRSHARRGS
jgi:hypothetical protein